jgi:hypothetical protein
MSAEEKETVIDDIKVHSYVLAEHDKQIKLLKDRTHDIKSTMDGMVISLKAMDKTVSSIVENQCGLNKAMDEFTTVKNILMGRVFWILLGMGSIIVLDHIPMLSKLISGN